jgi:hypothetical protein
MEKGGGGPGPGLAGPKLRPGPTLPTVPELPEVSE